MLNKYSLFSFLIVFISSCNTFKIADRVVTNKFEKANLVSKIRDVNNYRIDYWDSDDDIIPVSVAQSLQNHMNDCRLEVIPKTKHMPNIEKPKLFNEILINFLTE